MKIDDIIALAKAGFTAEQIGAIAQAQQAKGVETTLQAPTQTPAQATAPAPAQAPAQPAQPVTQPVQAPAGFDFASLFGKLDGIQQTIQQQAILGTQQPKPETVEDILASIINPPKPNKEGQ